MGQRRPEVRPLHGDLRRRMSRFFASAASFSESDEERSAAPAERRGLFMRVSDAESDAGSAFSDEDYGASSSGSGSESGGAGEAAEAAAPARKSRFEFESSSSEDDDALGGRAVRSQAERMRDAMAAAASEIESYLEGDDASLVSAGGAPWPAVDAAFDALVRALRRARGRVSAPREALQTLDALEKRVSSLALSHPDAVRALPVAVARPFNALRQKTRKAAAEYAAEIAASFREEDDADAGSGSEEEAAAAASPVELTEDTVLRRLAEVLQMRGRKHADRGGAVAALRAMLPLTEGRPRRRVHVLVALVACGIEAGAPAAGGHMALDAWHAVAGDLEALVALVVSGAMDVHAPAGVPEEDEHGLPGPAAVRGTVVAHAQRLDDEWTRALQTLDPHGQEYVDYLRAEPRLFSLLWGVLGAVVPGGLAGASGAEYAAHLAARLLEHVHAKPVSLISAMLELCAASSGGNSAVPSGASGAGGASVEAGSAGDKVPANQSSSADYPQAEEIVPALCRALYACGAERLRVRALLQHVYWLALVGRHADARGLYVGSRVADALGRLDAGAQVAHNRALVCLGLAAFRAGALGDAYACLAEVVATGRPKELLAQGAAGHRYAAEPAADRARLVPFHMQLSVELVDAAFLASAALLETPQAAAAPRRWFAGDRRLYGSRHLRRISEAGARAAGLHGGPPENSRERILAAARDLAAGAWRSAEAHLLAVPLWASSPAVCAMLSERVRDAALLAFVLGAAPGVYASLSVAWLAARFDVSPARATAALGALVADYGLPASLSPAGLLVYAPAAAAAPLQETLHVLGERASALGARAADAAEAADTLRVAQARVSRLHEALRSA